MFLVENTVAAVTGQGASYQREKRRRNDDHRQILHAIEALQNALVPGGAPAAPVGAPAAPLGAPAVVVPDSPTNGVDCLSNSGCPCLRRGERLCCHFFLQLCEIKVCYPEGVTVIWGIFKLLSPRKCYLCFFRLLLSSLKSTNLFFTLASNFSN